MAAWTVGTMMAGASIVSAEEALGRPAALTVTIHVTDNANLSPKDLAEPRPTHRRYRDAGLDMVWSSAPGRRGGRQSGSAVNRCPPRHRPRDMAEKKCREEAGRQCNGHRDERSQEAVDGLHTSFTTGSSAPQ